MGGAAGFEAEILLPKKTQRRLWAGILAHGVKLLHFMVAHPIEERAAFEPLATQILSSLRFLDRAPQLPQNELGLPLPPGYTQTDPAQLVEDISQPQAWQAYRGAGQVSALQAFYLREAPIYGWDIQEYVPYPGGAKLGFARMRLEKETAILVLGILPASEEGHGDLIIKRG
jgi:hypothetical protein